MTFNECRCQDTGSFLPSSALNSSKSYVKGCDCGLYAEPSKVQLKFTPPLVASYREPPKPEGVVLALPEHNYAGYHQGCRCLVCREAAMLYQKAFRAKRALLAPKKLGRKSKKAAILSQ